MVGNDSFVFLSYARKDSELVQRLREDVMRQGISVWIDTDEIPVGTPDWEQMLRDVIKEAAAVLLAASPSACQSRVVRDELSIAELYQRPIYPVWITGEHWVECVPLGMGRMQYIDARESYYAQGMQDLVQALRKLDGSSTEVSLPPAAEQIPPDEPKNPYKGLEAFGSEDSRYFFGRTAFVTKLIQFLQRVLETTNEGEINPRLLAVIGPSGSGKSSVVSAGLFPALQQGTLTGSQEWMYVAPMMPGPHPIAALADALSPHFPARSITNLEEDLKQEHARGLHRLIASLLVQSPVKAVLFIDQFEELFVQTSDEQERKQFLELVINAIREPKGPLIVVLTLRADFYDRPLRYPELGELMRSQQELLLPMSINDLREVIEGPVQLPDVGVSFEKDLVGDLLFEMRDRPEALPLLQFTLTQLFERRDGLWMTGKAYGAMGGVSGALARHAEAVYTSLPGEFHRTLARALFLRLVYIGTIDQEITKRRIALRELVLRDEEKTRTLNAVWNAFTTARLLTTNAIKDTATIEISHEALLKAWPRLSEWLKDTQTVEDIKRQAKIQTDAADWVDHNKSRDLLYRGMRFAEAQAWQARNIPNSDEDAFLDASKRERERVTRRVILSGIGGIVVVASTGIGIRIYIAGVPQPASKIARPGPISLPYAYREHTGSVNSVAWSPDGSKLASASDDATVHVWSATTAQTLFIYKEHTGSVNSVAWSPDGTRLASASADKTVRVWLATTGRTLLTYTGHAGLVYSVAWSPDGSKLASASDDATVHVWSATTAQNLLPYTEFSANTVLSVAWSPDGSKLAAVSPNTNGQVWSAATGLTYMQTDPASSVAWSPDSSKLTFAFTDKTMRILSATTGKPLLTYTEHTDFVNSVAWSPDGDKLASAGYDTTIRLWLAATAQTLFIYTQHTDSVNSVAWSPDGDKLASASADHTVQIWPLVYSKALLTYTRHVSFVYSVAWSPDSSKLASAAFEVYVWSASTGKTLLSYFEHAGLVYSVAWSPDGSKLASASNDGTVRIWSASTGKTLLTYREHTDWVYSVAWSPDGSKLASAGRDKTVHIWSATTGKTLLTYREHMDSVNSVAWSPDGSKLASASDDRTVHVWSAITAQTLLTYREHTGSVKSVAWSPDNSKLASASTDKTVRVWLASTGKPLLTYTEHPDSVNSVAWSPDGTRLASASADNIVRVWSATTGRTLLTYTGHRVEVLSVAWSPDGSKLASSGKDATVQISSGV